MWIKTSKPPASLTLFACTSQAWLVPFDGKSWALYIMVCICQHNYLLSKCLSTSHLSKNNYGYIHWIYIYIFIPKWHIKYIHVCMYIYIYIHTGSRFGSPSLPPPKMVWYPSALPKSTICMLFAAFQSHGLPFAFNLLHFKATISDLHPICSIWKPYATYIRHTCRS